MIIRPGAIGDCILALPAMEFLRTGYTEVWTPSAVVPLIRFANRVRTIAETGLDLFGLPDLRAPPALYAALSGFDSIVSWYGSGRQEFREELLRIAPSVEFFAALPPLDVRQHCADFFATQVGAPLPAIPRIASRASVVGDYAVIHPFSGSPRKNWPLDRWADLAQRLPLPARWCTGPEDCSNEAIREPVQIADLYELAEWIAGARVYIGNDSGITHLAAAVGVPVVAVFGPTDPAVWGPRGANVTIVRDSLNAIWVERVLAEVNALMR